MIYQFQSSLISKTNITISELKDLLLDHKVLKTKYRIVTPEGFIVTVEYKNAPQKLNIKIPKSNMPKICGKRNKLKY